MQNPLRFIVMKSSLKKLVAIPVVALLVLLSGHIICAQTSPGSIRGRVVLPSGANLEAAVSVRLESLRGVRSDSFTDNEGHFLFDNVPVGIYQVVIEPDKNRFEPVTVNVEVFPNAPSILTITLKEKGSDGSSRKADTITSSELDTQIPPAAKREFDRASVLSRENRHVEAIAFFQKAIAIYPRYLQAINDLGTQLLALGRLEEAAAEFRRAMAVDQKAFNPHLNLGIVLVQQHEFADASEELRKAVSLQANSPAARLYLGIALMALDDEINAESELKAAYALGGSKHAIALYYLGQLYFNQKKNDEALKMFERYLNEEPGGSKVPEVKQLIALIQ